MKMPAGNNMKWIFFLLVALTIFSSCNAREETVSISENFDKFLNVTIQWRVQNKLQFQDSILKLSVPIIIAGILCFIAAAISSAGGIGGGGLYLPILTIFAGLDLKTASSFSAFMVTGGSIANVACNMIVKNGGKTMIDYDIALLSEPCILLGVSIGVICNVILPEWLITIMFVVFLAWTTFKTFKSGMSFWKLESEWMNRNGCQKLENGVARDENEEKSGGTIQSLEEPLLLHKGEGFKVDIPWMKLGMLTVIWFFFFVLYLLRGNRHGQGIVNIEPCGLGYWIISSVQIPLAIIFTSWILCSRKTIHNQELESGTKKQGPDKFMFPVMALLVGALGGVFGIGGGMLISPLLLQMGISPEITAATCSFMVFFSSTMSAFQYLLLGMQHVYSAIIFSIICFIASLVGLIIVQRAIAKQGRASLIVFSVAIVMALSTVLMSSFGALDVWNDYITGKNMGFKKPC